MNNPCSWSWHSLHRGSQDPDPHRRKNLHWSPNPTSSHPRLPNTTYICHALAFPVSVKPRQGAEEPHSLPGVSSPTQRFTQDHRILETHVVTGQTPQYILLTITLVLLYPSRSTLGNGRWSECPEWVQSLSVALKTFKGISLVVQW